MAPNGVSVLQPAEVKFPITHKAPIFKQQKASGLCPRSSEEWTIKPLRSETKKMAPAGITVRSPEGKGERLELTQQELERWNVKQLKSAITEKFPGLGSPDNITLIHQGMPMDIISALLPCYNIINGSQVQVVRKVSGG